MSEAPDVHALFDRAVAAHRDGDLARARDLYEIIRDVASSPQVDCNLATVLRAQGKPAEAEALYRRAVAAKPDFAEAYGGLGNALRDLGRLDGAIEAYRMAIARRADFADAHVNLGDALQGAGRYDEAAACFEAALALRPDDEATRFSLAAVRGDALAHAPASYARQLFDSYADRFDRHLVGALRYGIPTVFRDAVGELLGEVATKRSLRVADLGCGTGLCGAAIRDVAAHLSGIDLAPRMVAKASERGVYDDVVCGDIHDFLRAHPARFDLLLAGDLLVYVGALDRTFAGARAALREDGLFAFSVETCDGPGFVLRPTARFAHSDDYVAETARAHGFAIASQRTVEVRLDRGVPVAGAVYLTRRS